MKRLNTIFSGLVLGALAIALAVGTVWVQPAQAQYDPNAMPSTNNLRALIVNSFTNLGGSGGNQEWGRGSKRNAYPHNGTGAGSFGAVLSQFTSNQKSQMYNDYKVSGGEGIWLLNADKGTVGITGPRGTPWLGERIVPLPYDPVGQAEENWGVPNPLASNTTELVAIWDEGFSATLSNYWPGVLKSDVGSYYENDLSPGQTRPAQIANYGVGSYNLVNTEIPEETIIAQWVDIRNGIQVTRRVYDWSNPDFDDFYLMDLTFKNTGDFDGDGIGESPGTINQFYIGFKNSAVFTAMGVLEEFGWNFYPGNARGVDDILWYTEADGYPNAFSKNGAFVGQDMRAVIRRDSDNPLSTHDDTGDPFFKAIVPSNYNILQTEGQPRAPSTYFFAPIAFADDAGKFSFNAWDQGKYAQPASIDQPFSFQHWIARSNADFDDPTPTTTSEPDLAAVILKDGYQKNPDESDPSIRKPYLEMTVYGPYTLADGEEAKIVLAIGAGHPSLLAPTPANQQDAGILAWDRSSASPEAKIEDVKVKGEMAALECLNLAHWVYDNSYQVPASPTEAYISPDNLTSSGDARQLIRWPSSSESAINPYKGTNDILGYRVYRSTWFSWGPWELWDIVAPGSSGQTVHAKWTPTSGGYEYEDLDTAAGFSYFYSVRPYQSGYAAGDLPFSTDDLPSRVKGNIAKGYESGWAPPSARTYDGDGRKPFQPVTAETNSLSKKVMVVPNPYFNDGKHTYPNSRNIRIVGLPAKCKIHIYSASGDRVMSVVHDNAAKGEDEFRQIAFNIAGEVQTGLYYFVVVADGGGATQSGSFVLIK
jgi:hypothetical protein